MRYYYTINFKVRTSATAKNWRLIRDDFLRMENSTPNATMAASPPMVASDFFGDDKIFTEMEFKFTCTVDEFGFHEEVFKKAQRIASSHNLELTGAFYNVERLGYWGVYKDEDGHIKEGWIDIRDEK